MSWFGKKKKKEDPSPTPPPDLREQVEQVVKGAQDQHKRLSALVDSVEADQHLASAKLARLTERQTDLEENLRESMAEEPVNQVACEQLAERVAQVRNEVTLQQEVVTSLTTAMETAQATERESQARLQTAMRRRGEALSELDHVAIIEQYKAADVSLDDLMSKVDEKAAISEAEGDVDSSLLFSKEALAVNTQSVLDEFAAKKGTP